MCCSVLQWRRLQGTPITLRECSVLQCVAVCCSVLQCVAVCCSVLQCVEGVLQCVAVCCNGFRLLALLGVNIASFADISRLFCRNIRDFLRKCADLFWIYRALLQVMRWRGIEMICFTPRQCRPLLRICM